MAEDIPESAVQALYGPGSPRPIHSTRSRAGYRDVGACPARLPLPAGPGRGAALQAARVRRAGCSGCGAGGGGGCGRPRCSCSSGSSPRTTHCRVQPQRRPKLKGGSLAAKAEMRTRNTSPFYRSCCVTPGKKGLGVGDNLSQEKGETQDSTTNLLRKLGQLLRLPLPIPTYHGASEGRKSGAGVRVAAPAQGL